VCISMLRRRRSCSPRRPARFVPHPHPHPPPPCPECMHQLNLPYELVGLQCRKLLDGQLEADAGFLNFSLDALVVRVMGTRSRDFQLDLCDESVAIMDPDLLVGSGGCVGPVGSTRVPFLCPFPV
jgi:hypothetical protein